MNREQLLDPDYMDRIVSDAVRSFRLRFVEALEAAEDNPDGVYSGSSARPLP